MLLEIGLQKFMEFGGNDKWKNECNNEEVEFLELDSSKLNPDEMVKLISTNFFGYKKLTLK